MIDLRDRHIVVVGGCSGIGLATATAAAGMGARVTVADVDEATGATLVDLEGGRISFVRCDACDAADVRALFDAATADAGRVDGLLTAVGGAHPSDIEELSREDWEHELDFNLGSVYTVARAAVPIFRAQRGGSLVTITSLYGAIPGADRPAYVAAKAGVIGFTRSLAAALAPQRARGTAGAGPDRHAALPCAERRPRRRRAGPGDDAAGGDSHAGDCANAVLFLLSDAARQITGQVLHVNGGLLMA